MNCTLAQDQYPYLRSFASLPSAVAGQALLDNNLGTVINLYQNATTAQRNQASLNADTDPTQLQYHMWGMISGLGVTIGNPGPTTTSELLTALAINASSFQNGSAGAAFVPLGAGVASSTNLASAMANSLPAGVNNNIQSLLQTALSAPQIEAMKDSFGSYNAWYDLGLASPAATYPYPNTSGATPTFPASQDLRPYQISTTIFNAPGSSLPASQQTVDVRHEQSTGIQVWVGQAPIDQTENVPSFPSGHSTEGTPTALLYAILMPQAYQSLMVSAQQFGLSRNISGRALSARHHRRALLAYYTMAQLLAGTRSTPSIRQLGATSIRRQARRRCSDALGPALTAVPYASCAANVAACIANGTFPTAGQFTAANQAYALQATYGLPSVRPDQRAGRAAERRVLIASRFPYSVLASSIDMLASTELPSGGAARRRQRLGAAQPLCRGRRLWRLQLAS